MRSESERDSLIALPSSCINSFSFSSTPCPFLGGPFSAYHSIFLMLARQVQFHTNIKVAPTSDSAPEDHSLNRNIGQGNILSSRKGSKVVSLRCPLHWYWQ